MSQQAAFGATQADPRSAVSTQRVAFVTLGQTPRNDVVPELRKLADRPIEVLELGVLDDVPAGDMARLAPSPGHPALLTRLRDGSDVVLSLDWTSDRMRGIYAEIAAADVDLVVLMSTLLGEPPAIARTTIFCDRVVARAIETFVDSGLRVGIVLSLESQGDMVAFRGMRGGMIRPAVARPGDVAALESAIDELSDSDLLVLHSVTYAEAERAAVAERSGKPVVMARHLVASAIREALDRLAGPCGTAAHAAPRHTALRDRLRTLSQREREIMFLVADGLANKEIAFRLGISFRTVEIHRARMMGKMEFSTMADLVRTVDSLSEF